MIQPNGLCHLVGPWQGKWGNVYKFQVLLRTYCLFFMPDDGFMVMQENVFISQKCIFMGENQVFHNLAYTYAKFKRQDNETVYWPY